MPPRSKVIVTLPAHIRAEVERRMAENGFSDYRGLAESVRQQGYEISDDSLWRYGKGIQRQLAAAQITVHQARALAEAAADNKGILVEAIMTVVEQKILTKLLEGEPLENADIRLMNAVANLARATVFRQRRADEVQAQEHKPPMQQGLSEEAYHAIRNALLGIDPFKEERATAPPLTLQPNIESGPSSRPLKESFQPAPLLLSPSGQGEKTEERSQFYAGCGHRSAHTSKLEVVFPHPAMESDYLPGIRGSSTPEGRWGQGERFDPSLQCQPPMPVIAVTTDQQSAPRIGGNDAPGIPGSPSPEMERRAGERFLSGEGTAAPIESQPDDEGSARTDPEAAVKTSGKLYWLQSLGPAEIDHLASQRTKWPMHRAQARHLSA